MRDLSHSRTARHSPSPGIPGNRRPIPSSSNNVDLRREAARAVIPMGIAAAAAIATFSKAPQKVLVTMWISFAIVGTAAVIASAKSPRGFP